MKLLTLTSKLKKMDQKLFLDEVAKSTAYASIGERTYDIRRVTMDDKGDVYIELYAPGEYNWDDAVEAMD